MMMYDDLIKQLRYCGNAVSCIHCPYWEGCEGSKERLIKAADAIEELRKAVLRLEDESGIYDELPTVYIYPTKWISVAERLPEYMENVLVTDGVFSGIGWRDYYDCHGTKPREDCWISPNTNVNDLGITHWMPLPEPPKDGE